jgi:hypothetical protein
MHHVLYCINNSFQSNLNQQNQLNSTQKFVRGAEGLFAVGVIAKNIPGLYKNVQKLNSNMNQFQDDVVHIRGTTDNVVDFFKKDAGEIKENITKIGENINQTSQRLVKKKEKIEKKLNDLKQVAKGIKDNFKKIVNYNNIEYKAEIDNNLYLPYKKDIIFFALQEKRLPDLDKLQQTNMTGKGKLITTDDLVNYKSAMDYLKMDKIVNALEKSQFDSAKFIQSLSEIKLIRDEKEIANYYSEIDFNAIDSSSNKLIQFNQIVSEKIKEQQQKQEQKNNSHNVLQNLNNHPDGMHDMYSSLQDIYHEFNDESYMYNQKNDNQEEEFHTVSSGTNSNDKMFHSFE